MAENSRSFEHSETLFQNPDGSPMVFFMRPSADRQNLKPLVEHGGGRITAKVTRGCLKLAERGSVVNSDDYLSARYIEDCAKQNELLDTADFRVKAGSTVMERRVQPEDDRAESEACFDDDDSLSPASYIQTKSRSPSKGRQKYTPEEDLDIITFIIDKDLESKTSGKAIWRMLELKEVTQHTAESMSCHYRKVILPNLHRYKDDVDPMWLKRLKPDHYHGKQEFSYKALFSQNRDKDDHKKDGKCNGIHSEWISKKKSVLKNCNSNNAMDVETEQTEKNADETELSPNEKHTQFTPDSVLDDIDRTVQLAASASNTTVTDRKDKSTSGKRKHDKHLSSSDSPSKIRVCDSSSKVRKSESPSKARDLSSKARDLSSKARDSPSKARDLSSKARDSPSKARDLSSTARDSPSKARDTSSKVRSPRKERRELQSPHKERRELQSPHKERRELQSPHKERRELQSPHKERREQQSPRKERHELQSPHKERRELQSTRKERHELQSPHKERRELQSPHKERRELQSPHKERRELQSPCKDSRERQVVELDDGRITCSQSDDYSDIDFEEYAQKCWKTYDRNFVKSQKCTNSPMSVIMFDRVVEQSVKKCAPAKVNGKSSLVSDKLSPTKGGTRGNTHTAKSKGSKQSNVANEQAQGKSNTTKRTQMSSIDSVDDCLENYINTDKDDGQYDGNSDESDDGSDVLVNIEENSSMSDASNTADKDKHKDDGQSKGDSDTSDDRSDVSNNDKGNSVSDVYNTAVEDKGSGDGNSDGESDASNDKSDVLDNEDKGSMSDAYNTVGENNDKGDVNSDASDDRSDVLDNEDKGSSMSDASNTAGKDNKKPDASGSGKIVRKKTVAVHHTKVTQQKTHASDDRSDMLDNKDKGSSMSDASNTAGKGKKKPAASGSGKIVGKKTTAVHHTKATRQKTHSKKTASSDGASKGAVDSDEDECEAVCKKISADTGLAAWFVMDLMYWNSGDVQRTLNYIKWGRFSMDPPPWNEEDDKALGVEDAMLKVKYGKKDVRKRKLFHNPHP